MAQRVQITISADADQAQAVVNKLNQSLGNIGNAAFKSQIDSVNKLSEGMVRAVQISDQLVRTGYRLTLGLSAPLIAIASYAVKLGSELQSARIAFEVFTGSAAIATKHLADLQQFAITTPFNFTQLVGLSKYLQAAGIEAEKVIPLLRSVGNAVALTGGSNDALNRVVQQIVHIQTLARVTLRELNPIARAGIPVFELLTEAIRKTGETADQTAARLKKLIQSGSIPGKEFLAFFAASLDVRYPKGLEKVSQTLQTQLTNLVDALQISAAKIAEALAPAITFVLNILTKFASAIGEIASVFYLLPEPVRVVIGLFTGLLAAIGPLILAIGYFARAITSTYQLYAKLTGTTVANTAATSGQTLATDAAASAKIREAVAIAKVTHATEAETAAKISSVASRAAALSPQLSLFEQGVTKSDALKRAEAEEVAAAALLAKGLKNKEAAEKLAEGAIGRKASQAYKLSHDASSQIGSAEATLARTAAQKASLYGVLPEQQVLFSAEELAGFTLAGKNFEATGAAAASAASRVASFGSTILKVGIISAAVIFAIKELFHAFELTGQIVPILKDVDKQLDHLGLSFKQISNIGKATLSVIKDDFQNVTNTIVNILGGMVGITGPKATQIGTVIGTSISSGFDIAFHPSHLLDRLRDGLLVLDNELKTREAKSDSTKKFDLVKFIFGDTVAGHKIQATLDEYQKVKQVAVDNDNKIAEDKKRQAEREFKIALNRNLAQQEYNKLLLYTDEGERQSREKAIEEEGKQYGGLVKLNGEMQKYLDKLSTHVGISPGSDKSQEFHIAIAPQTEVNVLRIYLAQIHELQQKAQEDLVQDAFKADDEIFKHRITIIDNLTKAQIQQLQAQNISELISTQELIDKQSTLEIDALTKKKILETDSLENQKKRQQEIIDYQLKTITNEQSVAKLHAFAFAQTRTTLTPGGDAKTAEAIFKEYISERDHLITQLNARKELLDKAASDKEKTLSYETAAAIYAVRVHYAEELNKIYIALQDRAQEMAFNAVNKTLEFQKIAIDQRKQAELQSLEFITPISIQQALDVSKRKLQIEEESLAQSTALALHSNELQTAEDLRLRETALRKILTDEQAIQADLDTIRTKGALESTAILSKAYADLGNTQRQSALEQFRIVKENAQTVFDTIKHQSEGVLDAMFTKSKSVSAAIGDALKAALLTTFKSIVSSQISAGLTKLVTGQTVTFQTSLPGNTGIGRFGNALSRLGLGQRVIAGSGVSPNVPEGLSPEQFAALAQILEARQKVIDAAKPKLTPIPEPPLPVGAVSSGISNGSGSDFSESLKFLRDKFGGDIGNVRLEYNAVPVIVKNLQAIADKTPKPNGSALIPLDDDSAEFLNLLKKTKNAVDAAEPSISDDLTREGYRRLGLPAPVKTGEQLLKEKQDKIKFAGPDSLDDTIVDIKHKFTKMFIKPNEVSPYTNTPIYYKPSRGNIYGEYDQVNDIINLFGDVSKHMDAKLHEETHAAIAKSGVSVEDLANKLPFSVLAQGSNTLQTFYGNVYKSSEYNNEILARLISNQGSTIGIPKPAADAAIRDLITQLKSTGDVKDLALSDTLAKINAIAVKQVDYGNVLYDAGKKKASDTLKFVGQPETGQLPDSLGPKPSSESLSVTMASDQISNDLLQYKQAGVDVTGGGDTSSIPGFPSLASAAGDIPTNIYSDGAAASTAASSRAGRLNPLSLFPGIAGGATGGIALGASTGAIAGLFNHFSKPSSVQSKVKDLYGVTLDKQFAQHISDVADQQFGGNIQQALRSKDVLSQLNDYAVGSGQKLGGGGGGGFGIKAGDFLSNSAAPIGLAALPSFLNKVPGLGNIFSNGPGSASQPGGTPTFSGAPVPFGTSSGLGSIFGGGSSGGIGSIFGSIFGSKSSSSDTSGILTAVPQPLTSIPGVNGIGMTADGKLAQITSADENGNLFGTVLGAATKSGSKVEGLLGGLGVSAGLALLAPLLSSKTAPTARVGIQGVAGGALLGASSLVLAGHAGLLGAGIASGSTATLAGIGGLIGGGAALLAFGAKKGGVLGLGLDVAGGATAGFGIAGPAGAVIGAAVGAVIGGVRLAVGTKVEQLQKRLKDTYNLDVDKSFATSILATIDQKYGGSISVGIRSKEILDMLVLYAAATNQPFGIANKARASTLTQSGSGLTQQAIYENGKALSFANLGVYGGVSTTTIQPAQRNAIGDIVPYQQLPGVGDAAIFGLTSPSASLPSPNASGNGGGGVNVTVVNDNKLPSDQVGNYFDGRTVKTISKNPVVVSQAYTSALKNNQNRRDNAGLLLNANELLT